MFEIKYKIISDDSDDYYGQNGYFQIVCNGHTFGFVFESDVSICCVDLENWMIGLIDVLMIIKKNQSCYLCDTESFETWLSFKRHDDYVIIAVIKGTRQIGSKQIELALSDIRPGDWDNQYVLYEDFKYEILRVVKLYLNEISLKNMGDVVEGLLHTLRYRIWQIEKL